MEAAPQPLKKARKAKDLTANKPVPPSTPEQLVGVKQEVNGDGHVTSTPFLVVQTEGLAAAEALTGSAEPSVQPPKRAKKKKAAIRPAASAPTAVSAAPTPLLSAEEQQRQPAGAQAGLAAADSSRGERQQQAGAHLDSMPQIPATDAAKPRARGRKKGAAAPAIEAGATAAVKSEDAPAEAPAAKGRKRASKAVKAQSVPEVAIDAVTDTAAAAPAQAKAPRRKKAAPKADMAATEGGEEEVKPKRSRRAKTAPAELPPVEGVEGEEEEEEKPKKKRRGKAVDPNAFVIPGREILEVAQTCQPGPRPVPNLGYACLNMDLREQKPPVFTNRDCIKKTWTEKGVAYISELALENARALPGIIQWNHEHGIRFFRLTSNIFPWCTEYDLRDLPGYAAIADELAFAGRLARAYDQRLTFHPSHFVKLAAEGGELLGRSIRELEVHAQVFDLMGYPPSHENKINIHIGGVYKDKATTLARFAANFKKLSPSCAKRLTVENDDIASAYSITDLLPFSRETGIPLVFDFHHHKFCPGDLTEREAVYAAIATWPPGIRPVVHWSESQEGRKPHAHSDFIFGPMELHGLADKVDVMIEAKCKERALIRFRHWMTRGGEERPKVEADADAEMAARFLEGGC